MFDVFQRVAIGKAAIERMRHGLLPDARGFASILCFYLRGRILENTKEIGILKSIGANDKFIGRVFGSVAFYILLKGLIIGNLIALGLAIFQIKTGIVTLPEADYYLSQVPVNFTIPGILLINCIVLLTGVLVMMIPAKIISGIHPIKVLRFD